MRPARAIAACLAAALVAAALLFACALCEHAEVEPYMRDVEALAPYARDHDLLNEHQKQVARETGRAAIYENGILATLEDVPEEYSEKEQP